MSQQTIVAVAITLVVVARFIGSYGHQPVSVSAGRLVVRLGALLLLNTDN